MSALTKTTYSELARIRRDAPDADAVRAGYRKADAQYRDAVIDGDGTPTSGQIITGYLAVRDAYAMYAAEKGINLEGAKCRR